MSSHDEKDESLPPSAAASVITRNERELERSLNWKLDCRILPTLIILFFASFLDRSNVGNAKIAGLAKDLHLKGDQYNVALCVFFLPYLLVDIPSNLMLKIVKANRWFTVIVCTFGVITTLTSVVQGLSGLFAIRFFLGLCEGGLLPGIIMYLSSMYPRHQLQLRVGIFYASASLSGAFGGLLASAILHMDGRAGLEGWRWIFLLEGIATFLVGFIGLIVLPTDIPSAKFLTEEEKAYASLRLKRDRSGTYRTASVDSDEEEKKDELPVALESEDEQFEMYEVVRAFLDVQTWITGLISFCILIVVYSYSLFLPSIVAGLGYSGISAQLHTVPPFVPSAVLTVVNAFVSDRLKLRGPIVLCLLPLGIIGYSIAIAAHTVHARYGAVFLISIGTFPCLPATLAWLPNNVGGHYKRTTSIAIQTALGSCAGFVSTFMYTDSDAPRYIKGHSIALGALCLAEVLVFINIMYCVWENKARREGRRQENITKYQALVDAGKTRAPIGDRHPDFRFIL